MVHKRSLCWITSHHAVEAIAIAVAWRALLVMPLLHSSCRLRRAVASSTRQLHGSHTCAPTPSSSSCLRRPASTMLRHSSTGCPLFIACTHTRHASVQYSSRSNALIHCASVRQSFRSNTLAHFSTLHSSQKDTSDRTPFAQQPVHVEQTPRNKRDRDNTRTSWGSLGEMLARNCVLSRYTNVLQTFDRFVKPGFFSQDEDNLQRQEFAPGAIPKDQRANYSMVTDLICVAVMVAVEKRLPHRAMDILAKLSHSMMGPIHPLLINLVLQSICRRRLWMKVAIESQNLRVIAAHNLTESSRIESSPPALSTSSTSGGSSSTSSQTANTATRFLPRIETSLSHLSLKAYAQHADRRAREASSSSSSSAPLSFSSTEVVNFPPDPRLAAVTFDAQTKTVDFYPASVWDDVNSLLALMQKGEIEPDRYTLFLVAHLAFATKHIEQGFHYFHRLMMIELNDQPQPSPLQKLQQSYGELCGVKLIDHPMCADLYRCLYYDNAYKEIEFLLEFMKMEGVEPKPYMLNEFSRWTSSRQKLREYAKEPEKKLAAKLRVDQREQEMKLKQEEELAEAAPSNESEQKEDAATSTQEHSSSESDSNPSASLQLPLTPKLLRASRKLVKPLLWDSKTRTYYKANPKSYRPGGWNNKHKHSDPLPATVVEQKIAPTMTLLSCLASSSSSSSSAASRIPDKAPSSLLALPASPHAATPSSTPKQLLLNLNVKRPRQDSSLLSSPTPVAAAAASALLNPFVDFSNSSSLPVQSQSQSQPSWSAERALTLRGSLGDTVSIDLLLDTADLRSEYEAFLTHPNEDWWHSRVRVASNASLQEALDLSPSFSGDNPLSPSAVHLLLVLIATKCQTKLEASASLLALARACHLMRELEQHALEIPLLIQLLMLRALSHVSEYQLWSHVTKSEPKLAFVSDDQSSYSSSSSSESSSTASLAVQLAVQCDRLFQGCCQQLSTLRNKAIVLSWMREMWLRAHVAALTSSLPASTPSPPSTAAPSLIMSHSSASFVDGTPSYSSPAQFFDASPLSAPPSFSPNASPSSPSSALSQKIIETFRMWAAESRTLLQNAAHDRDLRQLPAQDLWHLAQLTPNSYACLVFLHTYAAQKSLQKAYQLFNPIRLRLKPSEFSSPSSSAAAAATADAAPSASPILFELRSPALYSEAAHYYLCCGELKCHSLARARMIYERARKLRFFETSNRFHALIAKSYAVFLEEEAKLLQVTSSSSTDASDAIGTDPSPSSSPSHTSPALQPIQGSSAPPSGIVDEARLLVRDALQRLFEAKASSSSAPASVAAISSSDSSLTLSLPDSASSTVAYLEAALRLNLVTSSRFYLDLPSFENQVEMARIAAFRLWQWMSFNERLFQELLKKRSRKDGVVLSLSSPSSSSSTPSPFFAADAALFKWSSMVAQSKRQFARFVRRHLTPGNLTLFASSLSSHAANNEVASFCSNTIIDAILLERQVTAFVEQLIGPQTNVVTPSSSPSPSLPSASSSRRSTHLKTLSLAKSTIWKLQEDYSNQTRAELRHTLKQHFISFLDTSASSTLPTSSTALPSDRTASPALSRADRREQLFSYTFRTSHSSLFRSNFLNFFCHLPMFPSSRFEGFLTTALENSNTCDLEIRFLFHFLRAGLESLGTEQPLSHFNKISSSLTASSTSSDSTANVAGSSRVYTSSSATHVSSPDSARIAADLQFVSLFSEKSVSTLLVLCRQALQQAASTSVSISSSLDHLPFFVAPVDAAELFKIKLRLASCGVVLGLRSLDHAERTAISSTDRASFEDTVASSSRLQALQNEILNLIELCSDQSASSIRQPSWSAEEWMSLKATQSMELHAAISAVGDARCSHWLLLIIEQTALKHVAIDLLQSLRLIQYAFFVCELQRLPETMISLFSAYNECMQNLPVDDGSAARIALTRHRLFLSAMRWHARFNCYNGFMSHFRSCLSDSALPRLEHAHSIHAWLKTCLMTEDLETFKSTLAEMTTSDMAIASSPRTRLHIYLPPREKQALLSSSELLLHLSTDLLSSSASILDLSKKTYLSNWFTIGEEFETRLSGWNALQTQAVPYLSSIEFEALSAYRMMLHDPCLHSLPLDQVFPILRALLQAHDRPTDYELPTNYRTRSRADHFERCIQSILSSYLANVMQHQRSKLPQQPQISMLALDEAEKQGIAPTSTNHVHFDSRPINGDESSAFAVKSFSVSP